MKKTFIPPLFLLPSLLLAQPAEWVPVPTNAAGTLLGTVTVAAGLLLGGGAEKAALPHAAAPELRAPPSRWRAQSQELQAAAQVVQQSRLLASVKAEMLTAAKLSHTLQTELQDLETLVSSIQTACKTIKSLVERSHITGRSKGSKVGQSNGGMVMRKEKPKEFMERTIILLCRRWRSECGHTDGG